MVGAAGVAAPAEMEQNFGIRSVTIAGNMEPVKEIGGILGRRVVLRLKQILLSAGAESAGYAGWIVLLVAFGMSVDNVPDWLILAGIPVAVAVVMLAMRAVHGALRKKSEASGKAAEECEAELESRRCAREIGRAAEEGRPSGQKATRRL